jgi:hypothetical protein
MEFDHMISAYFQTVNILFLAHSVGTFLKVLCYKFNLFQNHWFKNVSLRKEHDYLVILYFLHT